MSKREVIAYAITHAPPGVKGGPYEDAYDKPVPTLREAWRGNRRRAKYWLAIVRRSVPHARVIRIVRARPSAEPTPQPSEASAITVLRDVEKDRATDEELGRVFGEAYTVEESPDHGVALRTAYLAVAAHVRKERCLVAQAVAMRAGVTISRTSERVPGTTGMWDVYVTRRPDVPGEHYAYGVPTADVPATLARLLGRGPR